MHACVATFVCAISTAEETVLRMALTFLYASRKQMHKLETKVS